MIAGHITPDILHEALRRTPNHKAAEPDGVPGLVLKHMPWEFHEALHLLFQALAETGITPPTWRQSHTIVLYKKRGPDAIRQLPAHHTGQCDLQALDDMHCHPSNGLHRGPKNT
jgi:hypothetical protein